MFRSYGNLKKLTAILLSIILVVGILSATAFAGDDIIEGVDEIPAEAAVSEDSAAEPAAAEAAEEPADKKAEEIPETAEPEAADVPQEEIIPEQTATASVPLPSEEQTAEETPQPADKEIREKVPAESRLTKEKDTYTIRLTLEKKRKLLLTYTGGIRIDFLDEQTGSPVRFEGREFLINEKDESGEWLTSEEIMTLDKGTYYLTVTPAEEMTEEGYPFSILFEKYTEPDDPEAGEEETEYEFLSFDLGGVTLSGMMPKGATATAVDVTEQRAEERDSGEGEVVAAYDITILNGTEEYQPDSEHPVSVEIAVKSIENSAELSLNHIKDDGTEETVEEFTVEDDKVCFEADAFSVYEIIKAPEVTPKDTIVKTLSEIESGEAYYFSIKRSNWTAYMTSVPTANNTEFQGNTNVNYAEEWYFELTGSSDTQKTGYLYRLNDSNQKEYLIADVNKISLSEPGVPGTVFTIEQNTNTGTVPNSFYIYHTPVDTNYALSVRSTKNFFLESRDNGQNTNECVVITRVDPYGHDPYDLDGKTYAITYFEESVKGAGLLTQQKTATSLEAAELLLRPDVLNNDGELLIYQDNDLPEWKFEWVRGNKYRIVTQIGGANKYLYLNGSSLTLSDTPAEISVESGKDEHSGKYRFSSGRYDLTLRGGKAENGFVSSNNGGEYVWLSLAKKSHLLDDDDFVVYSAEKVDLSDREKVPDGAVIVLYTRLWNPTTKKYEFYVVRYDGTLERAFESGDMIQWIGGTVVTEEWDFTEYTYTDGTPNFYYELQNTYSGQYIAPQAASGQILSDSTIGINLNGRRYGYSYSDILAWDDDYYSYVGLKVENGRIVSCPMNEAEDFYFAIMKPLEPEEKTPVTTVDHEQYGITMKMVDFTDRSVPSGFLGNDDGGATTVLHQGLLSTNLDSETGYPTATLTERNMSELYSRATPVNHLFIENTYYSSGYYEFDSSQNYATLYNEDGTYNGRDFTVYEELGTSRVNYSRNTLQHGQFLPYNDLSDEYSTLNPYNMYAATGEELPDADPRKGEPLRLVKGETDYYFGVEIGAKFTQTPNGLDAWGHDIIYEFTGDDDFWLYVDGELIIDLGGIHSAVAGNVNFSTGEVYVNGTHTTIKDLFVSNYRARGESEADIAQMVADKFTVNEEGNYIFKEYTDHQMRIFYMERGAGASNLHMRFNLASVKPGTVQLSKSIDGVEDPDSYMAEFPYQIFYKEPGSDVEQQLIPSNQFPVVYKDTNRNVKYYVTYRAPDGQTTYNNVFMLRPGETAEISFPSTGYSYRIQECFVDTDIYEEVKANSDVLDGTPAGTGGDRKDFTSSYDGAESRSRIVFTNKVRPGAVSNLTFTKELYDESGTTRIPHSENDTEFSFRLYLGTENDSTADIPLANMYNYHVKDENGDYCRWNSVQHKFISLGEGKNDFSQLTDIEKYRATFQTSMNGSISRIPVDYTVEVREVPIGTKYMIEERPWEVPDGYTLQRYSYPEGTISDDPEPRIITGDAEMNRVTVRNLKGWGLRVYKEWSDADWMEQRDPIYFAVFRRDGSALILMGDTVRQLKQSEDSVYWFFQTLIPNVDFRDYVVREVVLSNPNPTVEADGHVTDYGTATPIDVNGTFDVSGKQFGDAAASTFTYTVVSYEQGLLPQGSNVREDTATNRRAGIDIYKTDWAGQPLSGAVFTIKDGNGLNAGAASYTSDSYGFVTTAYLREGEEYTLTETTSPTAYRGMQESLKIKRTGSTVTVSGGESGYYILDDTDISTGTDMRIGSITVKNKPYLFEIRKTDASGIPLSGTRFALYRQVRDSQGNPRKDYRPITGYEDLTTGYDGLVPLITDAFSNGALKPGTYYLYETYPTEGYRPLLSDVIFTVSSTGVVTLGNCPSGVAISTDESNPMKYTITIPNDVMSTVHLKVKKTVANGTTADESVRSFNYLARLYRPDGSTPWEYEGFEHGMRSFSLTHDSIEDLVIPYGAVITIKEDPYNAYTTSADMTAEGGTTASEFSYESSNQTSTVRIKDDKNLTVTYTNTRKTVDVTVKKTVKGGTGTFDFTAKLSDGGVNCKGYTMASGVTTNNSGEAVFHLTPPENGSTSIVLKIPYGSDLKITEAEYQSCKTEITYDSRTYEGRDVTVTSAKSTGNQSITFTNTLDAKLTITKTVAGDMGDPGEDFVFTLTGIAGEAAGTTHACTKTTASGETITGNIIVGDTFTLKHGEKIVITMPLNKAIQFTEANGNYSTSWVQDGTERSTTSSVSVTLTGDSTLAVTNTLSSVAPNNVPSNITPFIWMAVAGAALLAGFTVSNRMRKRRSR